MNNPYSVSRTFNNIFPFITWLKGYRPSSFRRDALAGFTVATMLIPQAMAYAMLAGMPPVYGLYAAAVTPFIASLWGSLRQLSTGPIAIMSLLVLTSLSPLAEPGSKEFIELAFLLSFMIGILYLGIGLLRLGEIMFFISNSAVKGFTSAAALIIIVTQLPNFLGLTVAREEYFLSMLAALTRALPSIQVLTFAIGLIAFAVIYAIKKYRPHFPAAIIVLALAAGLVAFFRLNDHGVAIVGVIPGGLPAFHLPIYNLTTISSLLGPAVVIALVSFAETYSVGKAISVQTGQRVNVDQEFIGQGLANLVGSFFQSFPVSGSFSRTAINFSVGARTGVSGVVSSLVVVLALLFFTPLFTHIPRAVLAAVVISAVLLLFHPLEVIALWRMNRDDGIVALTVFTLALLTKPSYALLIGVIVSLMVYLWKTMHPRIVRSTKDPMSGMFVNGDEYQKPSCPQVLQLRLDSEMYFGNTEYMVEHILEWVKEVRTPLKFLLLDFRSVSFIDLTGTDGLRVINEEMKKRGIVLAVMRTRLPVKKVLQSSGFIKELKPDYFIENGSQAIATLFRDIDHGYCHNTCPYELFFECANEKVKSVSQERTVKSI